jgi:hypothetical protein
MANHCSKHKNFIPSCKACIKARDLEAPEPPSPEPTTQVFVEQEMDLLNKIKKATEKCTKPWESIVIQPQQEPWVHLHFWAMEERGYEFKHQLMPAFATSQYILIFKKRT